MGFRIAAMLVPPEPSVRGPRANHGWTPSPAASHEEAATRQNPKHTPVPGPASPPISVSGRLSAAELFGGHPACLFAGGLLPAGAQKDGGERGGRGGEHGPDREGDVIAGRERGGQGRSGTQQRVGASGRQAGEDRQAERAT